ncbi:MAG TPA: ATP-binding protein [Candidatus Xenobia bacterium]
MRNLRNQLFLSHFLLIVLMMVMMGAGVGVVTHLGWAIDRLVRDNYDSVEAAQQMDDALESQQEAALLMLLGDTEQARQQYQANWDRFRTAYQIEANNITEPHEQEATDDILNGSNQYRHDMQAFMAHPDAAVLKQLEPEYHKLKLAVGAVRAINQDAMRNGDRQARSEAGLAALAGVCAAVCCIGLSVWLALRSINHSLLPLNTLVRQAEEIGAGHWNHRIELYRSDEIGALAEAFNRMAAQLREAWAAEEQRRYVLERMANMALDNLQDAVLVVDSLGMVMHANRVASRLFGPVREPGAVSMGMLVQAHAVVRALELSLRPDAAEASETVNLKARAYRLRTSPIKDDERMLGAVAILEDVTHLQELDRLKTEFIEVASHELKTPVTSLLLSAQLLAEGAAGPLTDAQRQVVAAQRQDLERLERTMRDLLDMSKLESGLSIDLSPTPAAALVGTAVDAVTAEARALGVELASRIPPEAGAVMADSSQIGRVLINLLSNAIRHAPGGRVEVSASPGPMGVTFAVKDDGEGIAPEYLARIFDRFVQVPGATQGGAGLGLSIARRIVLAHRSDIQVESTPSQGSTFRFTLNAAEVPHG